MQTQTSTLSTPTQHTVKFHGTIGECFKIWFINLFLIIVTLGIYSFWAIIKMKRFFYQNTEINGYRFDFHAKPIQYIKGFLIGIAFYAVFIFLEIKAPEFAGLLLLVAIGFLPWLVVKSWQFQLRMTSLNGVRFDFKGNLGTAYWVILFLPSLLLMGMILVFGLLTIIIFSLGFYEINNTQIIFGSIVFILFLVSLPIISAIINFVQLQYFVNHTLFGNQYFQTNLKKRKMIRIEFISLLIQLPLLIWGLALYIIATAAIIFAAMFADQQTALYLIEQEYLPALIPAFLLMFLGIMLGAIYRTVALRNYLFSQTTINGLQLKSTMRVIPFFWLIVSNLLIIIFSLGLCSAIAHIRMARYMAKSTHIIGDFNIDEVTGNSDKDDSMNTEPVVDAIISVL